MRKFNQVIIIFSILVYLVGLIMSTGVVLTAMDAIAFILSTTLMLSNNKIFNFCGNLIAAIEACTAVAYLCQFSNTSIEVNYGDVLICLAKIELIIAVLVNFYVESCNFLRIDVYNPTQKKHIDRKAVLDDILQLKKLNDLDVITQEEYNNLKALILNKDKLVYSCDDLDELMTWKHLYDEKAVTEEEFQAVKKAVKEKIF